MIETKDYISWGLTLASLIFAAWQYYEKKKEQARNRANIQLTVGYPIKFVPNSETQHLLDFHEPKQEYNLKCLNITITNIGRELMALRSLVMLIDGRLQEFVWQPSIIIQYKEQAADLKGDELRDYEYFATHPLGELKSLSETFVITRIFIKDITGHEWELPKDKLQVLMEQIDKDNPIRIVERTI